MSHLTFDQWVAAGRHFELAWPIADLASTLHRYGYVVGTIGNRAHFDASTPEDHTTDSATGWPGKSPFGWVFALDVMPPSSGSGLPTLDLLGGQMIADKINGHPGMAWLKYQNWQPRGMGVRHESFEPGHVIAGSSDSGHIHQSCRTDYQYSRTAQGYDPVARVRAGGGIIPVVTHPPVSGAGPAFPGRVLIARTGAAMMHGTDVRQWQQRMHDRGWRIGVDGIYFTESANVCHGFQVDSNAHRYPLDIDSKVGPNTWRASWARPIS